MSIRDETLWHYGREPLTQVHSADPAEGHAGPYKPSGLWFSVGDDWQRWCEAERFNMKAMRYRTPIMLDINRVIWLHTPFQLDEFTKRYGCDPFPDFPSEARRGISERMQSIDWATVGKQYGAMMMPPYCWPRRMELMWYYGWDCASGCVWDATVVEGIGAAERVESAREKSDGGLI